MTHKRLPQTPLPTAPEPPQRLSAILDLIPHKCNTIADIGYDHGYLIRRLMRQRPQTRVIGIERQQGLDDRFWRMNDKYRQRWQSRIELRHGEGLGPLQAGEADCLVFAGLGEPNILEILAAAPEKLAGVRRMVFSPVPIFVGMAFEIQRFGWRIVDEVIAAQGRHFYRVQATEPGSMPPPQAVPDYFGPVLFERKNPFLYEYLRYVRKRLAGTIANVDRKSGPIYAFCKNIDAAIDMAAAFSRLNKIP